MREIKNFFISIRNASIYHSIVRIWKKKVFIRLHQRENNDPNRMRMLQADCVTFDLIKGQIPRFYSHYLIYNLHVFAPYHHKFSLFLVAPFFPFSNIDFILFFSLFSLSSNEKYLLRSTLMLNEFLLCSIEPFSCQLIFNKNSFDSIELRHRYGFISYSCSNTNWKGCVLIFCIRWIKN